MYLILYVQDVWLVETNIKDDGLETTCKYTISVYLFVQACICLCHQHNDWHLWSFNCSMFSTEIIENTIRSCFVSKWVLLVPEVCYNFWIWECLQLDLFIILIIDLNYYLCINISKRGYRLSLEFFFWKLLYLTLFQLCSNIFRLV